MRLLLDECLPKQLKREFPGHAVMTVPEAGLAGVKNGALLKRATERFDVFITVDANLRAISRISPASRYAFWFCVRSATTCLTYVGSLPAAKAALVVMEAGTVVEVT